MITSSNIKEVHLRRLVCSYGFQHKKSEQKECCKQRIRDAYSELTCSTEI